MDNKRQMFHHGSILNDGHRQVAIPVDETNILLPS